MKFTNDELKEVNYILSYFMSRKWNKLIDAIDAERNNLSIEKAKKNPNEDYIARMLVDITDLQRQRSVWANVTKKVRKALNIQV
tara:strand:- start:606 stop:857 length:252 start_codon:yes stop_codon:yes gene_type:complete